ncbi:Alkaline-phosphatase-like, core domain [Phytophthora cactorum]|nr:Alkaline-phosphatase-like, core domain [Phytophthora cactorum]
MSARKSTNVEDPGGRWKNSNSLQHADIETGVDDTEIAENFNNQDSEALLSSSKKKLDGPRFSYKRACLQTGIGFGGLVIMSIIVVTVSCVCSPLVAYSAMNVTLNELFSHALEPTVTKEDSSAFWAETFIHNTTEKFTLFGPDTLYRRTTGFQGGLSFDVEVSADNPPNVLLIAVESFRFHDSHYLVGDEDPSNLFKGKNFTVTPNFDKWAKRGIALRNFWSSIRTSRALESLLFGQIPLRSLDIFLPTHGFDNVWNNRKFVKLAESDLGITHDQWFGPEARGLHWGVHDDVSFQLLGDLLVNKTKEQRHRMAQGGDKNPLFLTHFTISSHGPFTERPQWYAESEKPDFSVLYQTKNRRVQNATKTTWKCGTSQTWNWEIHGPDGQRRCAIIAEGRLGDSVGLIIEDARYSQYLADITGVPKGGFVQDGVGRSVKHNVTSGERVVFSNDPNKKMSIVRGHERLRYDRVSDSVSLHNFYSDHKATTDLFPELTEEEQGKDQVAR